MTITNVTPDNAAAQTLFCVLDIKSAAFEKKYAWFVRRYEEGLRIKYLKIWMTGP